MIYIDPPYNTGSDGFVYQDDRTFTPEQLASLIPNMDLEEAQRILAFTHKKASSHSAWLTFMHPRLYLARELLTEEGVIFISIDDNEVAQLRLLCDEIFGEENFVADLIWKNKKGGGNDAKYIAIENEHVLLYGKNKSTLDNFYTEYTEDYKKRYKEKDEYGQFYWDTFKRKSGKQHYSIECPDGTILEKDENNNLISWLRSEKTFKKDLANGEIRIIKIKERWSVQFKQRLPKGKKPRSILDIYGTTSVGSDECLNLFRKEIFNNPKPTTLLKHFLQIATNKNDLILDFFAGSGTTADAVMQLNAEDGGRRKFILVQLPELIDEKKSKTAYDFVKKDLGIETPTIFEITKERIKRSAQKIEESLQDLEKDNLDLGFKIFELTDNFLEKMRLAMLQNKDWIEEENAFSEENLQTLLTSWRLMDGNLLTTEVKRVDLSGVTGFLCGGHFYVLDKEFGSTQVKAFFNQLDNDPDFQPNRFIFLGEQIASDVQRTLKEGLQQLSNKKSLHITLTGRY